MVCDMRDYQGLSGKYSIGGTDKQLGQRGSHALIKNKIKFSSYIRKFRAEQLQSHI